MSKYTTELRYICESLSGLTSSVGWDNVDTVIENSRPKIFSFNYPLFDSAYKSVIETKILRHYYTREIGLETYGLWKLKLETKLNEIMPYYNQLYKSELIQFNPLYDTDLTREHNTNKNDTDNTKMSSQSEGRSANTGTVSDDSESTQSFSEDRKSINKFSETPQGGISNLEDGTYLTNATINEDTSGNLSDAKTSNLHTHDTQINATNDTETTSDRTYKSTEDYLEHVSGKQSGVSYSKLLNEYRDTFLNIDMEIIDACADLFMNIW